MTRRPASFRKRCRATAVQNAASISTAPSQSVGGIFGLVVALLFVGCTPVGTAPTSGSQPASAAILRGLNAHSLNSGTLNYTPDGKRLAFNVAWNAPEVVHTPMRLRNGLPHVACRVNGREVWMILDTGSQRTVLEAETALKCGVQTIQRSVLNAEIGGTNGIEPVLGAVPETMSIGGWQWNRLPCFVRMHRTRAATGVFTPVRFDILGMDAIRAMCSYVTLDYRHGEVIFGFKKPFQSPGGDIHGEALQWKEGIPVVTVTGADGAWPAILDTGAASAVQVDRATAVANGWWQQAHASDRTITGLGSSPAHQSAVAQARVPHLQILGREVEDLNVLIVPEYSKIGTGFLRYFKTTLDLTRSRLFLE